MIKKTVVDSVVTSPSGVIEVRIRKYNEDGSWVYHRTSIEPGVDPTSQMALVNVSIARDNSEAVAVTKRATFGPHFNDRRDYFDSVEEHALLLDEEVIKVIDECRRVHTPEMVVAFRAARKVSK